MAAKKAVKDAEVSVNMEAEVKETETSTKKKAKGSTKKAAEKETTETEATEKETKKKQPARRAKKTTLKSEIHIQFEGKSYSQEDLMNIAKDVWTYDLNQKPEELTSVEFYVKPQENMVYYVMNEEFTGSFYI